MSYTYNADGVKLKSVPLQFGGPAMNPFGLTGSTGAQPQGNPIPGGDGEGMPGELTLDTSTLYCGNVIFERGELSKLLTDEGYVTFTNDSTPVYHYYLRDHLGNVRVVFTGGFLGDIEQRNDYYPSGALMATSTGGSVQPYKYNGKELERTGGLDLYDYGARWMDSKIGARFTTMDPMCEKYYGISPYAYCGGNPVRFIDPDGRFRGDYLTSEGELIDSDGQKDGKLYVLKTSKSQFDSSSIAGITSEEVEQVIRNHDISNKDNFVEITGSQKIREAVVSKIKDDGLGGISDNNNREYLITFDTKIGPDDTDCLYLKEGEVGDPTKNEIVSVSAGDLPDVVYIHTHPSGEKNGQKWYQAPSKIDVDNTTTQKYVIGMGDKTVYIYNKNGINATLPLNVYKDYKVTNGK